MYTNIMQAECCICLNNIHPNNIFTLECCNNQLHHECIIEWIKSSIDNSFSEYNKCILCRSFNTSINDIYHDLLTQHRKSQINIVIDDNTVDNNRDNNNGSLIIFNNYQHRCNIVNKIITCCNRIIFITTTIFSCYIILNIIINISYII